MKETTGKRLRKIMEINDLRQVDILQMCQPYCEKYNIKLAKNDLSQYINDKVQPGQDKLSILGMALKVSEAWLMGFDVPMEPDSSVAASPAAGGDPVVPVQLRSDESELLDKYNLLNAEGMKEIHNHADYIASQDRFLKDTSENIREVG